MAEIEFLQSDKFAENLVELGSTPGSAWVISEDGIMVMPRANRAFHSITDLQIEQDETRAAPTSLILTTYREGARSNSIFNLIPLVNPNNPDVEEVYNNSIQPFIEAFKASTPALRVLDESTAKGYRTPPDVLIWDFNGTSMARAMHALICQQISGQEFGYMDTPGEKNEPPGVRRFAYSRDLKDYQFARYTRTAGESSKMIHADIDTRSALSTMLSPRVSNLSYVRYVVEHVPQIAKYFL